MLLKQILPKYLPTAMSDKSKKGFSGYKPGKP